MGSSAQRNSVPLDNALTAGCSATNSDSHATNKKRFYTNGNVVSKRNFLTAPKSRLVWQKFRRHLPGLVKLISTLILWIFIIKYAAVPLWPVVFVYYLAKLTEQGIMYRLYTALPFDSTDALWMQERPENRTIINALLVLRGEAQVQNARDIIMKRMVNAKDPNDELVYPRTRQYVYSGHLNFFWMEEESFNINDHVQLWSKCTTSKREQRSILSMLCSRPFHSKKSPWEIILVPHIDKTDSKTTAVLFRAHHSMADGISLARLLIRVIPDNEPNEIPIRKFPAHQRFLLFFKGILYGPLYMMLILCSIPDESILHGNELVGKKKLTWSKGLDLNLIKKIKNSTRVTVNDVLMSCYGAALRDFFIERGKMPPEQFSVSLPVDLRPDNNKHATRFKNNFAMIPFKLSINIQDPLLQLFETKKRMNALKMSGEPFAISLAMRMFSCFLPHFITKPMCKFACEKTTAVLSNVPGPQNQLRIGGHELESMTFWPPQRDRIGMALSMTSYNGKIFVGVESDEALAIDPDEICKKYEIQLKRLASRLGIDGYT